MLKRFFWFSSILGLFLTFTNAKFLPGRDLVKSLASPVMEKFGSIDSNTNQGVVEYNGKKYVRIEEKWYEARANNQYKVKGVPTLYINNARPPEEQASGVPVASGLSEKLTNAISKNPLSAYSPQSIEETMRAAEAAKKSLEDHNKKLEDLLK